MTNFEKIKAMSAEQMADILSNDDILIEPCKETECRKAIIKWLNSEVANHE